MDFLLSLNHFIWGVPALLGVIGIGIYLSFRSGFCQLRLLPHAFKYFAKQITSKDKNRTGTSPYQALCTALAATVGTGNLAGVAGAIAIGGPGSVFWMWICALLGMVTKFSEATLAIAYRVRNRHGEWIGGPMYMIQSALGKRWHISAYLYSFMGVVAAFGVGNATQINAVIGSVDGILNSYQLTPIPGLHLYIGVALAALIGSVLLGGAKRIGALAEQLVPFAAMLYIMLSVGVLIVRAQQIPQALCSIVQGAFSPQAVTGGAVGSFFIALRTGAARGVITNEAGMGTAAIAHAGAEVKHPVQQGLMGIMEVFVDTIVICTLTALVILCSGVGVDYGCDTGIELTIRAFSSVYGGWISIPLTVAICCLALATVFGWGLYGIRCAQFLLGEGIWRYFVWLQVATVIIGAILKTDVVWLLTEIVNGLMAIPNLMLLFRLAPNLLNLLRDYRRINN